MNSQSNNLKDQNKNSGLKRFSIICLAIVAIAVCIAVYATFTAPGASDNNPDSTATEVGDIDHPTGKTFECELTFLDMNRANLATPMPQLPTPRPSSYDNHKFRADTEYIVQFDFPNMLLAEIENDDHDFEIDVKYEFEVAQEHRFHTQVRLYNKTSGNLYVANGAILTADDLCLKHSYGAGTNLICDRPQFEEDHFAFSIYTSALPDAGPKTTESSSYGGWGYNLTYTIAGMTADEWDPLSE